MSRAHSTLAGAAAGAPILPDAAILLVFSASPHADADDGFDVLPAD
jgi:hypothetical protein